MAIIGGLLSIAGNVVSALGSSSARSRAADKQNTINERLSSTAYQRGMKDMRLAGLNPILAYKQGPASSPIGTQQSFDSTAGPIVQGAASAVSSMIQNKAVSQGVKTQRALEGQHKAQTKVLNETAKIKRLEAIRAANVGDSLIGRNVESLRRIITGAGNSAQSQLRAIKDYFTRAKAFQTKVGIRRRPKGRGGGRTKSLQVPITRRDTTKVY